MERVRCHPEKYCGIHPGFVRWFFRPYVKFERLPGVGRSFPRNDSNNGHMPDGPEEPVITQTHPSLNTLLPIHLRSQWRK